MNEHEQNWNVGQEVNDGSGVHEKEATVECTFLKEMEDRSSSSTASKFRKARHLKFHGCKYARLFVTRRSLDIGNSLSSVKSFDWFNFCTYLLSVLIKR